MDALKKNVIENRQQQRIKQQNKTRRNEIIK
jgi:hypothetical protein